MSTPTPDDARLLTIDDAATIIGKSSRWLRHEVSLGRVPEFTRVGSAIRFTRDQLDAYIASLAHRPTHRPSGTALAGDAVPAAGEVLSLTGRSAQRLSRSAVTR